MKNTIDIILICIIVVLVLACAAAGVLGYYTHGWTMWDLSEESTVRIIEDDSISVEMDEDQQQGNTAVALEAGEGYAVTSAENDGYIEKAFVPLYCWPSKFDMWKDIEWSISYTIKYSKDEVEYTKEKLTMRLDETRPNLVWLECTGVFWGSATVTAAVGDLSASCSVRYEPVYLGLGIAADSVKNDTQYEPVREPNVPVIDGKAMIYYGDEYFKTGNNNRYYIGLLNHFGELELIDQSSRSVWEESTVAYPSSLNATVEWWYGGPNEAFINDPSLNINGYDNFFQIYHWPDDYEIIKGYSIYHTSFPIDLLNDVRWLPEIEYESGWVPGELLRPWLRFFREGASITCHGRQEGHYWYPYYTYGFSHSNANGFDEHGDCLTTPYFYAGFVINPLRLAEATYSDNCSAYRVHFDGETTFPVSITYGEYTLDIVFDFSKAEELVSEEYV